MYRRPSSRSVVLATGVSLALVAGPYAVAETTAPEQAQAATPLYYNVPQVHVAPAAEGDTFSATSLPYNRWQAVAVESKSANNTLSLYNNEERTSLLARSALAGSTTEFVAYFGDDVDPVFPVVTRKSGQGKYTIEGDSYGFLNAGTSVSLQATGAEVLQVFTVTSASTGETLTFTADPLNGKLDVSLFLMSANGSLYRPRTFAVASADAGGPGVTETLVYDVPSSQTYGLVMLFEQGKGNYSVTRTDT